jgi:hypothetical protein
MKHLRRRNKKHLFTKVDILIDSNNKALLYSGIIVDYELQENQCDTLSKVMLQNAERYTIRNGKKTSVEIPGNLLVVDCSSLKNINFTYIYEEAKSILDSKMPNYVEIIFGLITLFIIPASIFRAESIEIELYQEYFNLHWFKKIITFLLVIQIISLFNPFVKENEEYKYVKIKNFLAKTVLAVVLFLFLWYII